MGPAGLWQHCKHTIILTLAGLSHATQVTNFQRNSINVRGEHAQSEFASTMGAPSFTHIFKNYEFLQEN